MMRSLRRYGCSSSRETSPTPPDAASGSFPNYGGDGGDDDGGDDDGEDIKTLDNDDDDDSENDES